MTPIQRMRSRRGRFVHPIQALEPRRLLAAVSWDGGGDGVMWSDGRNWSGDRLPAAADDVTLDGPTTQFPNVIDVSPTIHSLTANIPFAIGRGDFLSVATTATLGAKLYLSGGGLRGGVWQKAPGSDGVIQSSDGRLDGTSLRLSVIGAAMVTNGLVVDDSVAVGGLRFIGTADQAITGTGTIEFDEPAGSSIRNDTKDLSNVGRQITLGSGITVHANALEIWSSEPGGTVLNLGRVTVNAAGGALTVRDFINEGEVHVAGGATLTATSLRNNGLLDITGGALSLLGNWSSSTEIGVRDAGVSLGGTFAASELDRLRLVNSPLRLDGVLNATGGLALNDSTGSLTVGSAGVIRDGTVTTSDSARLTFAGGSLSDVTFPEDLAVEGEVRVTGRLDVGGRLTVAGNLRFTGADQNFLGGGGRLVLAGAQSSVLLDTLSAPQRSLTIEPGMEITGTSGGVGPTDDGGTIRNQGRIAAEAAAAGSTPAVPFQVGGFANSAGFAWRLINEGTIAAGPGAMLDVAGNWSGSPGTMEFDDATVRLGGTFTGGEVSRMNRVGGTVSVRGTIDLKPGPLTLTPATGPLSLIENAVLIGPGAVDSEGGVGLTSRYATLAELTLNAPLQLERDTWTSIQPGVRINGLVHGGGKLGNPFETPVDFTVGPGTRFSGVFVASNPMLEDEGATLTVDHGMRLQGTISLRGRNTRLVAEGSQTWTFGIISFETPEAFGAAGATIVLRDGPPGGSTPGASPAALTLDEVRVRGGRGAIVVDPTNAQAASLLNRGWISADTPDTELRIDVPTFTSAPLPAGGPDNFGYGTVRAVEGGTVRLLTVPTNFESAAGTLRGGEWVAKSGGSLLLPEGVLVQTNAADVRLSGAGAAAGRFPAVAGLVTNNGLLSLEDGYVFAVSPAGGDFLTNGVLQIGMGGAAASGQFGVLSVGGTVTLAGTLRPLLTGFYRPSVSDAYRIINAGSVAGAFDTLTPSVAGLSGNEFYLRYDASGVTLAGAPPAAGLPDLVAASDTGASATDNITTDSTPTIAIRGAAAALIRVILDGAVVAEGTPDARGNYAVTLPPLGDGTHTVVGRSVDAEGDESGTPASRVLTFTVDTVAPVVTRTAFQPAGSDATSARSALLVRFNEPVSGPAIDSDVEIVNVDTRQTYTNLASFSGFDPSISNLTYTLRTVGLPAGSYRATFKAVRIRDTAGNPTAANVDVPFTLPPPGAVAGRSVYYNNSVFDANGAGPGPADDNAIAPDKRPLLPGQPATAENVTSYSGGINGIIVDLTAYSAGAASLSDFEFKTGNGSDPLAWSVAPAPAGLQVRQGAGAGGSNRVSIVWPDGAITNVWLQVTVRANRTTGLASPDVFYFGNLVGEAGDGTGGRVNAQDLAAVKRALNTEASVTSRFDFNRDGRINAQDLAAVKQNLNRSLTAVISPAAVVRAAAFPTLAATSDGGLLGLGRPDFDVLSPTPAPFRASAALKE